MNKKIPIVVAYGDGIGPEIMKATLSILEAAKAPIEIETIEIGKAVYLEGYTSGIPDDAWKILKDRKILLKGPITTPQGGGYKSLNVTLRKTLGLYANVRPCISYAPFIHTPYANINLVIIRENEEDTYAGIEHRQTEEVYQCLKIVTRPGCEQIIRYAFQYARKYNRKKVTCFTKDNIMKMTDGLFHRIFDEIAKEYPDIIHEHRIVDIGTALIATEPQNFDVIVTLNLYGDIISDVAAQIAGSVGLAGSANVGHHAAMFEAIHGSAPDIADKDIANPSGLLNASILMLIHINAPDVANLIENAWLKTIEDGVHTADMYTPTQSKEKVGTQAFAEAIINRMGQRPSFFVPAHYQINTKEEAFLESRPIKTSKKSLVGVDVFIDNAKEISVDAIASKLLQIKSPLKLIVITSRGLKIWPDSRIDEPYLKQACCRFQTALDTDKLTTTTHHAIIQLLENFEQIGLDVIKTENLYTFDDQLGFTLAQGQ